MERNLLARLTTVGILFCLVLPVWAQQGQEDLTQRSLVDLMNIEVTSVAKKEQRMSETASAVFVISQDDIRRSGATNIPDLLRMVPGVDVAQINSNKWAISVRGFNGQYSNKLLVLVDGRTVYTPLLSGVFWDAQDVPMDSIDRIEVIRGPGATVWGANAVNGVINIITKRAGDTQGGRLSAGVGSYEHGSGTVRYGGMVGPHVSYRISGDGLAYNHLPNMLGGDSNDDWKLVQGGIRVDAKVSANDSITVEGNGQSGNAGELSTTVVSILPPVTATLPLHDRFSGWHLLSKWDHIASPHSETSLQIYFDRASRGDTTYGGGLKTFDLNLQHHIGWGERHDFVCGLGYRVNNDKTATTMRISFDPASRTTRLFSAFVQDEISVLPDRVYISLGAKVEHNDDTGWGLQPSARIRWTPSDRNTYWAAVSQAERTPARSETNIRYNFDALMGPNGLPVVVRIYGNPNQKNENLLAVEAGYRTRLTDRISVDSTLFFNRYRDLVSLEPGKPFLQPSSSSPSYLVIPSSVANLNRGETHGLEVFANWTVIRHWNLSPGYSFLTAHLHRDLLSRDFSSNAETEGGSPNHKAQLRSHVDLPGHWGWNSSAYFVGRLPYLGVSSYTRLDTNVTKQLSERVSITLNAENLLKDRHMEYMGNNTSSVLSSMSKRSVYAKLTWWF